MLTKQIQGLAPQISTSRRLAGFAVPIAPAPPASLATLRVLVLDALNAQLELARTLRALEQAAGSGPWRGDLVIAMEKAEASGFWFREGTRSLQASKGSKLLPDVP